MAPRGQALRWWFAALLLLLPLVTFWNLMVGSTHPSLTIGIGRPLHGVMPRVIPEFSLAAIRDGRFQKAIALKVGESLPIRPNLIRLNNQIAYSLFGELNVPGMLIGSQGQLIQQSYLSEYCARRVDMAAELANRMIPVLQDIQAYYKARGGIFLYVITPSKAAHLPEYFVGRVDCPSTEEARRSLVPAYAERLRKAGIAVFDAATFAHGLKGSYPIDLFPRGGVHWNAVGAARATQEIIKAINQQAGSQSLPQFDFDAAFNDTPKGSDRDLADLMNVLLPPIDYPTARLSYRMASSCSHPSMWSPAAVIGGSFMHGPTELLIREACMPGLNLYSYLHTRWGGAPYGLLQADLSQQDLQPLRDVKLLLLEENELMIGRSGYVDALKTLLGIK